VSKSWAWLTPDSEPDGVVCRLVWIPNGEEYESAARGALVPLMLAENWEQFGSITPEQAAQAFQDAFAKTSEWSECMRYGLIEERMPIGQYPVPGVAGEYRSRRLNTLVVDGGGMIYGLDSDDGSFFLIAGTYSIHVIAPCRSAGHTRLRLHRVLPSESFPAFGQNHWLRGVETHSGQVFMLARFVSPVPEGQFRIEHYVQLADAKGFGAEANEAGRQERYTVVGLTKIS